MTKRNKRKYGKKDKTKEKNKKKDEQRNIKQLTTHKTQRNEEKCLEER